jgi:hypothetical protein
MDDTVVDEAEVVDMAMAVAEEEWNSMIQIK